MILVMLAAIQSADPSPSPAAPVSAAAAEDCPPRRSDNEIVVCGRTDQEQFRLRPLPPKYEVKGPGLGFDLGNGAQANVYSTQVESPDHKPDKRIVVKVKMPF